MTELLLLRHGKSFWDDPSLADRDRPLAPRGVMAATAMGRLIAKHGWIPERMLVSPALRTRQTAALAVAEWADPPATDIVEELYLASPEQLVAMLRRLPDRTSKALVVGHNPVFADLALQLAGPDSEPAALARLRVKFPTAGLARFHFEAAFAELAPGNLRLTDFVRPRDLP